MSSVHSIGKAPGEFTRIRPRPEQEIEEGSRKNIELVERIVSLVVGALMICGIFQQSLLGALTALVGAWLLYRGATGHCPVCSLIATRAEAEELDSEDETPEDDDITIPEVLSAPIRRPMPRPRGRRIDDWSELEDMPPERKERRSSRLSSSDATRSYRTREERDFEG